MGCNGKSNLSHKPLLFIIYKCFYHFIQLVPVNSHELSRALLA